MTDDDADRARDLVRRSRQIRTDAGVPIGAMADQAEVAKSTLSRWERDPPAGGLADPARPGGGRRDRGSPRWPCSTPPAGAG
jgi:DNA-binding XRE family transcriptional regulator